MLIGQAGFQIVQGSPHSIWCPVDGTDTLYVGQIVQTEDRSGTNVGVLPLGKAAGASNTTYKNVPFGIVIGTNNAEPVYDSTYLVEKITGVAPSSNARNHLFPTGEPHGLFGKVDMVKVALIDPTTVIRGPIRCRTAGGGAPLRERAVATASSTTAVVISTGCGFAATYCRQGHSTIYFRKGANQGQYRIMDITDSSTNMKWNMALANSPTTSDRVVVANMKAFGHTGIQLDSESMFINNQAAASVNYYAVNVIRLDLSNDGNEFVDFQFTAENFCNKRA